MMWLRLFILFLLPSLLEAQASFGILELRAAIFFHPKMQDYHFSLARFRRAASSPSVSPMEWEDQMQSRFYELYQTLNRFQREQTITRKDLDPELAEIAKSAPATEVLSRQLRRISEFDQSWSLKRRESLRMIRDWFLDEQETLAQFDLIQKQIFKEARQICAEKGYLDFVISDHLGEVQIPVRQETRLNGAEVFAFTTLSTTYDAPEALLEYARDSLTEVRKLEGALFPGMLIWGGTDITALVLERLWADSSSEIDLKTTMKYLYSSLMKLHLKEYVSLMMPGVEP